MKKIFSTIIFTCALAFTFQLSASAHYGVIDQESKRTLAPIRSIAESLGATIRYNGKDKTILINGEYKLTIGSKSIHQNNVVLKQMDTTPKVINGTTYIPVREVANLLGTKIVWNQSKMQVEYMAAGEKYILPAYKEAVIKKPKASYSKKKVTVNNKTLTANVVHINLLAPNTTLEVKLANNKINTVSNFQTIAKNNKAVAAINGNFFDAYQGSSQVYNGLISNGKRILPFGINFSVFYYTFDGKVDIVPAKNFKPIYDSGNVKEALEIGPHLLSDGKQVIDLTNFNQKSKFTGSAQRSAIGILPNNQIVFVTTQATVYELAELMKKLGATDAMNFDGGASSGLYYNGQMITTPGRQIAVSLIVK